MNTYYILMGVAAVLAAGMPGFLAWRQGKVNSKKGDEYHKLVNSRMDELIALTRQVALAEGKAEGVAEEKELNKKKL